ncbi:SAM-dependent methyltransferase [Actinomadura sp. NBRC 104425]|uniref:class I SAM-dependent methyltransferase n=1 Tax=Actinomadura sp. NBRC 104425 TaxID=3032204 RepID=UPI002553D027|nr:SAM-dependent methyltransferase [Actinomadura sp. NBRC 104425]
MDIEAFRALPGPAGRAVLAAAAEADLSENALLSTAARLRERYPADLVAAALTQARLRVRARAKFGPDADLMYFTPDGLEQATRARVAAHRAHRFAAYMDACGGVVLEMGCGIGADLIARARLGCRGEGVERDALTAAVARANVEALGLAGLASVREGDATREDPAGYAAVFADPGRRTGRGRVFDPRAYEPPLGTVMDLAARAPAGCVKVAPGIPHDAIPNGVEAEWISVGGDVKEAALWLGGLAGTAGRRATVIRSDDPDAPAATLTPEPGLDKPDVRPWGRYLYEPDGAVIRAHLVAEVAAQVGGGLADPRIAYVTADAAVATPFAAAYEIEDVLPFSVKRLRGELRRRDVGILTIKKRGSAVDVDRLRRDLGFTSRARRGGSEATVVLTRVGRAPVALLARPLPAGE